MKKIDKLFWERLSQIYNKNDLELIEYALNLDKPVTFRINKIKSCKENIINALEKNNIKYEILDFIDECFICENIEEKVIWNLDIYKNWEIYMQSISSQIPVLFLDLKANDNILDVTAAPGWKTSQIASILQNSQKEIIACDNSFIRLEKMKYNLEKQAVEKCNILKIDSTTLNTKFKEETFDKILADLPCSAEWRINLNNEKTYWFWSVENIKKNYNLQKNILKSVVPLLKKWWTLVYSTCTLAPEENEEIVHFLLSNFPYLEIVNIPLNSNLARDWIKKFKDKVYNKNVIKSKRFLPSHQTEWFFIAKFIRK